MKFEFEGSHYEIEFARNYRNVQGASTFRSTYPYTTVFLWKDEEDAPFRTFTVGCSHRDNFTKEDGRRNALRMLCKGNSLTPDFKSAMWEAYFSR